MKYLRFATLAFSVAAASAMAAVDPGLLNLVMPDAKILSGIQVDQSQSSPFGQYILSQIQITDDAFQKFLASTGFDPHRDLKEVLAASTGDPTATGSSSLVVARGNFQVAALSSAATTQGGTLVPYKGFTIVTGPGPAAALSIVFLDNSTAAMGTTDAVKAAIDRRAAGAALTGTLAQKATSVSANNAAWFVTLAPLSDFLSGKLATGALSGIGQNNLLQAVQQTSGGVSFGATTVTLTADATTNSNQNAQALVDVLKFLTGLIPVGTASAGKTGTLADTATLTATGTVAHMSLALPEQQVEQLFMPGVSRAKKAVAAR